MEENPSTAEAADSPRRRRVPPPTIDLAATEVPAPGAEAGSRASETPESSAETASAEAMKGAPRAKSAAAAPPPAGPGPAPRRIGSLIVAGTLGAAIALAVAAAWLLFGPGIDRGADADANASDNARLARIETQLDALAHRDSTPATSAPISAPAAPADTKALGELTDRLARIESRLAEPASAVDRQIKPLADRLDDLTRRNDEVMATAQIARDRADTAAKSLADVAQQLTQLNAERARTPQVARADLDALTTRLASVESATKAIGQQLSRAVNSGGGDARQAVVAFALKSTVERGAPYASELDAMRPFADAGALAALEPFAKSGVPSAGALAHEVSALVPALVSAADTRQPEGALARLWANARRMIRLRPVGNVQGTGADAVIARMELKAGQNDLDGVLAEADNLPAAARAPLEPWIKRVQARKAALAAADRVAIGTLNRLGRDTIQTEGTPQR